MTLILLLNVSVAAAAEAPVSLGTAASFAVLAGQGVTNTGPTVVNGDLGTCPNPAITGAPMVNGAIHANNAVACQAQLDLVVAYNDAAGRAPTTTFPGVIDLGGRTLVGGVYKSTSSIGLTGTLTLDAQGDANAVFIFQAASTLITATNSRVALINGAQACNVFWQVGSSATIEVGSNFSGTVLALTSIAAKTNAVIQGRLLARNGSVTLDSNTITSSSCASGTTTTTAPGGTTTTTAPATTTTVPVTTTVDGPGIGGPPFPPVQFVPVPVGPLNSDGAGNGGVAIFSSQNSSSNSQSSASSGGQVPQVVQAPAPVAQRAAPAPQLARTGPDVLPVAALGGLLFILGAALRADPKRKA